MCCSKAIGFGKKGNAFSFTVHPPENDQSQPSVSNKKMVRTAVAAGRMRVMKPATSTNRLQKCDDDDESDCASAKSDSDRYFGSVDASTDSCGSDLEFDILSDQPATPQQTAVAAKNNPSS